MVRAGTLTSWVAPTSRWSDEPVIGGLMGLATPASRGSIAPPSAADDAIRLVNARSAFLVVLDAVRPDRVWLPSYLCPVLMDVCRHAGITYDFYEVAEDLTCDASQFPDVGPRDLVVVIHYFGFRQPLAGILARERPMGWLLEDATQAFLTTGIGRDGAHVIYSPRKLLGVPDGALLRSRGHELDRVDLEAPPVPWWRDALAASLTRRDFDAGAEDAGWLELGRTTGRAHPIGAFRMSDLSRAIIFGGTDYAAVVERRRANHEVLAGSLSDLAVFPDLPDGVTPSGFPIRVPDRDRVRLRLFERAILTSVQWPLHDVVPDRFHASHALAREIMTLPCDQRYDASDMRRIASVVRESVRA